MSQRAELKAVENNGLERHCHDRHPTLQCGGHLCGVQICITCEHLWLDYGILIAKLAPVLYPSLIQCGLCSSICQEINSISLTLEPSLALFVLANRLQWKQWFTRSESRPQKNFYASIISLLLLCLSFKNMPERVCWRIRDHLKQSHVISAKVILNKPTPSISSANYRCINMLSQYLCNLE